MLSAKLNSSVSLRVGVCQEQKRAGKPTTVPSRRQPITASEPRSATPIEADGSIFHIIHLCQFDQGVTVVSRGIGDFQRSDYFKR